MILWNIGSRLLPICILSFFSLSCNSFSYILGMGPLLYVCAMNFIFHTMNTLPFYVLNGFFDEVLSFNIVQFAIFFSFKVSTFCMLRNICLFQCQEDNLCFPLKALWFYSQLHIKSVEIDFSIDIIFYLL